jgi:hypothetical protein
MQWLRENNGDLSHLHVELFELCGAGMIDIIAIVHNHKDALLAEFKVLFLHVFINSYMVDFESNQIYYALCVKFYNIAPAEIRISSIFSSNTRPYAKSLYDVNLGPRLC